MKGALSFCMWLSRDEFTNFVILQQVWFNNVPHTKLVEDKGGQNWISKKDDKFIFPGGGTQFIHGADQYLDQISKVGYFLCHSVYFYLNESDPSLMI